MTADDFLELPWNRGWNPVPDREWMASLADRWATFPAEARPRPVVLVREPEHVPGFDTDDGKEAWLQGRPAVTSAPTDGPARFVTDRGPQTLPTRRVTMAGTDARRSYGQYREVLARLERPVGGRVLLDVYGRAAVLETPVTG